MEGLPSHAARCGSAELQRQSFGGADTSADYPKNKLLHELFEERARETPAAVAVVAEGVSLTYADLDAKANQLACFLAAGGAKVGECIPVVMARSVRLLVAQLAVLKCGGIYVPVDPSWPAERLDFVLSDCGARRALADAPMPENARSRQVMWIDCATQECEIADLPRSYQGASAQIGAAAYVMYTSGSTGGPKGVLVPHHAVTRLLVNNRHLPILPTDRIAHGSNPAFDASTFETWGAWLNGASVMVVPPFLELDGHRFAELLIEKGITALWLTAALFVRSIDEMERAFRSLRILVVGGDTVSPEHALRVLRTGPPEHFLNGYGPTECTTFSTMHPISLSDQGAPRLPIGRPTSNTRIYILDSDLHPVPVGTPGELYIGGDGVALGYLHQAELTSQRFIPDPFSAERDARMFRSGDLGLWLENGEIDLLGRIDRQVKIRGFRVEPAEIECSLVRHARVREAIVVAEQQGPAEKRLVAYVVMRNEPAGGDAAIARTLREHLRGSLPDYMVPDDFVLLDAIPLTANGKVDRRALTGQRHVQRSTLHEAPSGEKEVELARIWREVLQAEHVGRHDNFFDLGGHSLMIMQMMNRLREAGVRVSARQIYESRDLAHLATMLTYCEVGLDGRAAVEAVAPPAFSLVRLDEQVIERIAEAVPGGMENIEDIYPLLPLQEGMLFHHLLDGEEVGAYSIAMLFSSKAKECLDSFVAGLQAAVARHEVLRTAVLWRQLPRPVQVVCRKVRLSANVTTMAPGLSAVEWFDKARQESLDLQQAPLLRLEMALNQQDLRWYLLFQTHHLICDYESLDILLGEVRSSEGAPRQRPAHESPYRRHVQRALSRAQTQDDETFFSARLADIDEPTAPFDLLNVYGDSCHARGRSLAVESRVAAALRRQARQAGVSVATLFHAAWGVVVARTSGRVDVVYGTVLLGRMQGGGDAQQTLGMFVNTLPLRLRLRECNVVQLIEQTQRELVGLLEHEHASIAAARRCCAVPASLPLFTSLLNFRHRRPSFDVQQLGTGDPRLEALRGHTNYPVVVSVDDDGEHLTISAETSQRVDPGRVAQYLCTAVWSLVEALATAPRRPALSLNILPDAERHQLVEEFNSTQRSYPTGCLIHELFEDQVRRGPAEIALCCEEEALTYAQVNARANQLARYLRRHGVHPGEVVAVCGERDACMVIALLAVLKSGAAYMPLDPSYPVQRLSYMIEDAKPSALLVWGSVRVQLPDLDARVVNLSREQRAIDAESPLDLQPDGGERETDLAYVIHTSGSSGRPKAVMVEHRGVVNLLSDIRHTLSVRANDTMLAITTIAFDISVLEIFLPLVSGARLAVVGRAAASDVESLITMIEKFGVTILQATPVTWDLLIGGGWSGKKGLRAICGGEALPALLADRILARVDELWNAYGPTETTIWSSIRRIRRPLGATSREAVEPIGLPVANTSIYIIDDHGQVAPMGVAGEIHIGGAGVSRGYLANAALTAERFVPDPFAANHGARMYRTGDFGRFLEDGTIEYLGRRDHQVKFHGIRIELGEIEAQLCRAGYAREAVVLLRDDDRGNRRLVAYVVPVGGPDAQASAPAEVSRADLKTVLPEYMIPAAIVPLSSLPRTFNGKIDRNALPAPGFTERSQQPALPRTVLEKTLARLWGEVLDRDDVGINDNFFDIGGDSLLLLSVHMRMNAEMQRRVPITDLLHYPTIRELAQSLGDRRFDEVEESEDAALRAVVEKRKNRRRRSTVTAVRSRMDG
jgi:amino acid adenylation domain-containing protein